MKIVMFSQTFCQPCKALFPILESICKSLNLTLEKWNVEDNWDLAVRYGVQSTPTVFAMNAHNEIVSEIKSRTAVSLMKELGSL